MSVQSAYMVPHPPLIIPEIGEGKERGIQNTIDSYNEIAKEIAQSNPETIIVISPHMVSYSDYIHISPGERSKGDFRQFGCGDISVTANYDTAFVNLLEKMADEAGIPAGTLGERTKDFDHGTMIPLYFLEKEFKDLDKIKIVRVGISGLSYGEHYRLGMLIRETAQKLNRKTVVIASGDLSHKLMNSGPYGYSHEGPKYDGKIMDLMERGEFQRLFDLDESFCLNAGECGHKTFLILAGSLDGKEIEAKKLSYEGPFGVGYGICSFRVKGETSERSFLQIFGNILQKKIRQDFHEEDEYVRLARTSLESFVKYGITASLPEDTLNEIKNRKAGVFVSLKINGKLRGCIGTILATRNSIGEEIIENAVSAGRRDPRFPPVEKEELSLLEYSVDVLGEPEKINSKSELDEKKYGVIVSKGYKKGLLLPNLEGVDSVEEQIHIACQKAGIVPGDPNIEIERFEVIRHK